MLIRSQRGEKIINLNNISSIYIDYNNSIIANREKNHMSIAIYSTKEKAIKALDMMQMYYISMGELKEGYNPRVSISLFDVFQMPQDNEVEV